MLSELSEIPKLRKQLGLTQHELAMRAQVSQSLVAKIEAGRIDPGYTSVTRIFSVLQELAEKSELTAAMLMERKVISVHASEKLPLAIAKMRKYSISQLPVLEQGTAIGLISESTVLDAISAHPERIETMVIADIMQDAPPVVPGTTSTRILSGLLKHYPLVMVAEKGIIKGVITKSDIIRALAQH